MAEYTDFSDLFIKCAQFDRLNYARWNWIEYRSSRCETTIDHFPWSFSCKAILFYVWTLEWPIRCRILKLIRGMNQLAVQAVGKCLRIIPWADYGQ